MTEDQAQLVAVARQFAERHLGYSGDPGGEASGKPPYDLLDRLSSVGWTGLGVPEELGGNGGGVVEQCLVLEELGRVGCISPLASAMVCAAGLAAHGDRRRESLKTLVEGQVIGTLASLDTAGADEWSFHPLLGSRDGDGWTLTGQVDLVPWGADADIMLCEARLDGLGRAVVQIRGAGLEGQARSTFGDEPRAKVSVDVALSPHDVLAGNDDADLLVADLRRRAVLLQTAWAIGAAEKALQLSVDYAKTREQFGRAIATFQSVSHRCADMRLAIDGARLALWESAWALDAARADRDELVSVAKACSNEAFEVVIYNAHQVHGAIGYSMEYPLQRYTRILKSSQLTWGSTQRHLDVVASAIGL